MKEDMKATYRRKRTQHFDPVLGSEGVRRVHGREVGQSSGGVCWGPAQDMTQLWRVGVNCVPCHEELKGKGQKYINKLREHLHQSQQCSRRITVRVMNHADGLLTSLWRKVCL